MQIPDILCCILTKSGLLNRFIFYMQYIIMNSWLNIRNRYKYLVSYVRRFYFRKHMSHSRDVTMLLNEISPRSGFTIKKSVALFYFCFRHETVKWKKICKKNYLGFRALRRWRGKPRHRLCCSTPSGRIHTRNTWKILIVWHNSPNDDNNIAICATCSCSIYHSGANVTLGQNVSIIDIT